MAPPFTLILSCGIFEDLHEAQHDGGEGLVQLPQVDVLHVMPARFSAFSEAGAGPVSMIAGSEPIEAKERMRARGFSPAFSPNSLVPIRMRGRAVDDARRIAGMVDVVDLLDLGIALLRHRVEARHHLALHLEAGLERGQRLHGRVAAA